VGIDRSGIRFLFKPDKVIQSDRKTKALVNLRDEIPLAQRPPYLSRVTNKPIILYSDQRWIDRW